MKPRVLTSAVYSGLLTVLIGISALAIGNHVTRGFQAITADGVRRIDLVRSPRRLPPIPLLGSDGKVFSLSDLGDPRRHFTLVALVYTRCVTICRVSASGQVYLQKEIFERGMEHKIKLLTLSFDPINDTPSVLSAYARRMKADNRLWTFATPRHAADLNVLLKLFGVVVLPDGLGGYSHNGALFLLDRQGRVSAAYDIDRPDAALADLLPRLGI